MVRAKFVGDIARFKTPVAPFGFRQRDPGAFYSVLGFLFLPLIPVGGYFALGYFGIDYDKLRPNVSRRAYNHYDTVDDARVGNNDLGNVYVYEYSDGTKEVKYGC